MGDSSDRSASKPAKKTRSSRSIVGRVSGHQGLKSAYRATGARPMVKVKASASISIDGFGAGPQQNPAAKW
jgi:hypothetical protein